MKNRLSSSSLVAAIATLLAAFVLGAALAYGAVVLRDDARVTGVELCQAQQENRRAIRLVVDRLVEGTIASYRSRDLPEDELVKRITEAERWRAEMNAELPREEECQ